MPEYHIGRLRIRPLKAAHFNAQAQSAARRITRVGIKIPGVVEIIIHYRKTFLIGIGTLTEIAVPASRPARIIEVIDFIRPEIRPGTRIVTDGRRATDIDSRTGLEISGTRFKTHDAVSKGTGALPFAITGLHNVEIITLVILKPGQDERRRPIAVIQTAAFGNFHGMENTQVHIYGIRRIITHHSKIIKDGTNVIGVVNPGPLGINPATLIGWNHGQKLPKAPCRNPDKNKNIGCCFNETVHTLISVYYGFDDVRLMPISTLRGG